MLSLVLDFEDALANEDYRQVGEILHESWLLKRSLTPDITYPDLDSAYEAGLKSGAYGGKLLGAGGGGFLMFIAHEDKHHKLEATLAVFELQKWSYFPYGSQVVFNGV